MKQTQFKVSEIEVSYRPAIGRKPIISSALDAYVELKSFFEDDTIALQEQFVVMYLNTSNRILGIYPLSKGGISGTVAEVRLILSVALKVAATGVILSHNHPSGNLSPSSADKELTKKIGDACRFMDFKLLDHIIITPYEGQYFSFADEGILT